MLCHCGTTVYARTFPYFCPCGRKWLNNFDSQMAVSTDYKPPEKPDSHWIELHEHRLGDDTPRFYKGWRSRIPNITCDCMANWKRYEALYPPDFSSDEAWFEWGCKAHDQVSLQHSNRPRWAFRDALAMFRPERLVPEKPLLIISIGVGQEAAELLAVTRQSHERYAASVGADYLALGNKTEHWWGFEKFRVKEWAEKYERTLFLDSDVWIKKDSPNLFDIVPPGCVGMHDDYPLLRGFQWLYKERQAVCDSQGWLVPNISTCLNTGVVLTDRSDAGIWERPSNSLPTSHCAEQLCVECRCDPWRTFKLPLEFNTQWWMLDFDELAKDAHFVHLANCKNRLEEIKKWTGS